MCRIAGIISTRLSTAELTEKAKIMCRVLKHGGPDDEGIFCDTENGLVFGHRRLSIIDLSANGHQPMEDVQQKACITFNGEIYNYRELRAELVSAGGQFRSDTDTEVIIQAYLHWGTGSFARLRGMFALALYDKVKNLTYLVRDSMGIKPLYYYAVDNDLSFASEVKALKEAGIATQADNKWQVRFLAFGHIPEPYTTQKDVCSLKKGHFLCWNNSNQTYTISAYNKQENLTYITSRDEAEEQIRNSLKASITRQLIADAPIGVFLSGGIDSSLLTLLANEEKASQLKTVSIFFNEKAYDESAYQHLVFNRIQGEKFTHLVKQQDFEACFPQIIQSMDMPTTDGINTWFISKYAQQDGLKAVLSGLGADELFGGYPSFNRVQYLKYVRKIPAALLSMATPFLSDAYKKMSFLAYPHLLADYLSLRGLFTPKAIAELLDTDTKQVDDILFGDAIDAGTSKYTEEYAAWMESNLYMQNQLLRDTDVMSMSHGLEVRVPFLDEDFQQLSSRIAPDIRFNKKQGKKLLIDSFKDILPEGIWNRPKMGFSFPLQQWMQQLPEIADPDQYSGKTARQAVEKFKQNKLHWSKSFALYQLRLHE